MSNKSSVPDVIPLAVVARTITNYHLFLANYVISRLSQFSYSTIDLNAVLVDSEGQVKSLVLDESNRENESNSII